MYMIIYYSLMIISAFVMFRGSVRDNLVMQIVPLILMTALTVIGLFMSYEPDKAVRVIAGFSFIIMIFLISMTGAIWDGRHNK